MKIDSEETLFLMFREELRHFLERWDTVLKTVGYANAPTAVCNSMLRVEDAFKNVNYKIPCEERKEDRL